MKCFDNIIQWQEERLKLSFKDKVGFVPTMGNLHAGHRSLLEQSVAENDHTVLSIYINPTQFNNTSDLQNYPQTIEADLAMAEDASVDFVLLPQYDEIYADKYRYQIAENELSKSMEGAHRPGHFEGMLTIVMKLLNMVRADRAYFGEKDYQQYLLVKGMAEAFFLPTQIIACPIIREENGLALSSRNSRLSTEQQALAPQIYKTLMDAELSNPERFHTLNEQGFDVEYIEEAHQRRFIAAQLGDVRLIDNVPL